MALQAWAEDLELSCLQSIVCIDIVLNCTLSSAAAMQMYIINTLYLILHFTLPFTCPNSIYSVRLKILHPVRRMLCTTQHNYVNSLPFSLSLPLSFSVSVSFAKCRWLAGRLEAFLHRLLAGSTHAGHRRSHVRHEHSEQHNRPCGQDGKDDLPRQESWKSYGK